MKKFIDTGLKREYLYQYEICAVNSAGQGKFGSSYEFWLPLIPEWGLMSIILVIFASIIAVCIVIVLKMRKNHKKKKKFANISQGL